MNQTPISFQQSNCRVFAIYSRLCTVEGGRCLMQHSNSTISVGCRYEFWVKIFNRKLNIQRIVFHNIGSLHANWPWLSEGLSIS